ncbi:MAG: hypothetical protein WCA08_20600 [Desulfoferrobacter sp.]
MQEIEKDRVVVEFQRRKKTMLQNFIFAMILIALGLTAKQFSEEIQGFLGIGRSGWTAVAIAQMIAGVVIALRGFLQYRCPVCNEIVRGHDKYYLGTVLNPSRCPKCGARLS